MASKVVCQYVKRWQLCNEGFFPLTLCPPLLLANSCGHRRLVLLLLPSLVALLVSTGTASPSGATLLVTHGENLEREMREREMRER